MNTNKLIKSYPGITGLKTGTTSAAGSCIAATAEREGLSLIAVVLGASSTDERFGAAAALLDYGFANYEAAVPTLPELGDLPVTGGMEGRVPVTTGEPAAYLTARGGGGILSRLVLPESVAAPVKPGDEVGRVEFYSGETLLGSQPVVAAGEVQPITIGAVLGLLLACLCRL